MTERDSISGIAIDVGGTKTAVARIQAGEIVDRRQIATRVDTPADQLIEEFTELVDQLAPTRADRIGAALTGRVDDKGYWHAVNRATLGSISKVPIASLLSQRLQREVSVVNDAVAGAIAESRFGSGTGFARMAYITVSTGVGAGIILDGKPLLSANGLVGHVGFSSSSLSTRLCGSGRRGTVESIASGKAIADLSQLAGNTSDPAAVFAAFRRGESWACDIITLSATAIAELIADLVVVLDLELVVIGGSVGLAEGYVEQIAIGRRALPELFQVPVLKTSLEDPVLLGALAVSQGY